jgi:hypothetical protein
MDSLFALRAVWWREQAKTHHRPFLSHLEASWVYHFVDRHDRTRLAPFYAVAVMNCEAALREQRQRPGPKVAKRSAAHPR